MNKKNTSNACAVIEIGTDSVRMQVSQFGKGGLTPLDTLEYPLRLDRDLYESGSIGFESLGKLSAALEHFKVALLSYDITKPKVVACAALREAKNRSIMLDQLRVRDGVDVKILENSEEKSYIYNELLSKLNRSGQLKDGYSLIAYVGTGDISVSVYDGKQLVYFQNVAMGALKLYDVLRGMRSISEDFHAVVEEYLESTLHHIAVSEFPISNLILTGSNIRLTSKLCGAKEHDGLFEIGTEQVIELYSTMRSGTAESIALRYGIPEGQAAVLYTAVAIYRSVLRLCPKIKSALCPETDIASAVVRCALDPKAEDERADLCKLSALACAERTARAFHCDMTHAQTIRNLSCYLFDKLKRIHGLDDSTRLILELASLLHSCGTFVSVRQNNRCTFDLVRSMDIFGLPETETLETALVAGSASSLLAVEGNPDFDGLDVSQKLVVSKLAAIFRIANALDKSHEAKLKNLKLNIEGRKIIFKAVSDGDTLLENWAFREAAPFFAEVFGLTAELTVRFTV